MAVSHRTFDADAASERFNDAFRHGEAETDTAVLAPIGLSAVTELSVPRVVGLMMGGWFLGTSYSEVLAAALGKLSSIEIPEGAVLDVADALAKYERASRSGNALDMCVQAKLVAGAYVEAGSAASADAWRARERESCALAAAALGVQARSGR